MAQKSRAWIIVDYVRDKALWDELSPKYEYMAYGDEICPKTGRPHFQGFLYCKNGRTKESMRKEWKPRHIEVMSSDCKNNVRYSSKESPLVEWGTRPKQGKRSDLENVRDILREGGSMGDVVEVATSYQSVRMAEVYLKYKEVKRKWKPTVYWFYGDTGTGKSETAVEMFPEHWMSNKNLKWWEGYDADENVIIDDFRGDFCTFHELLRILDRYEYRVECKGGSRQLLAKNIVITSPERPENIYNVREDIGQLLRRIDEVREFKKNGTEVMAQKSGVILEQSSSPRPNVLEYIFGKEAD